MGDKPRFLYSRALDNKLYLELLSILLPCPDDDTSAFERSFARIVIGETALYKKIVYFLLKSLLVSIINT